MLIPGIPNIPASRVIGATGHAVLAAAWILLGLLHWRHYLAGGDAAALFLVAVTTVAAAFHLLRALSSSASAHPLDCCLALLGIASTFSY
jgi:hypothetical protein